jgi:hypothetical protein
MPSDEFHKTNNDSPTTTKNDTSKVVRLNVGGTHYEVSRSLMEMYPDTMLARMISDEWSNKDGQEVFIDRNGPRFQYVLDYMRDQKAALAMNVTKESILTELEYFGFQNVQGESIDQEKANKQALEHVKTVKKSFGDALAELHDSLKYIQIECLSTKAASMVYDAHLRSKTSVTIDESDVQYQKYPLTIIGKYADRFKSALNARLSEHGLCALHINTHRDEVWISFQMDATAR